MKRALHIVLSAFLALLCLSCAREPWELPAEGGYPEGTPITMYIPFGGTDPVDVQIGTKAEASIVEEARVNDIYVFIFDAAGKKAYGRYFGYEHHRTSLADLDQYGFEGWFVENKSITNTEIQTRGAVKISTTVQENATLVVIANVNNSALTLNGDSDGVEYLNRIKTLSEIKATQVVLSQDIVARNDVFMKIGWREKVNTGLMHWGTLDPLQYSELPQNMIELRSLDAKVKFRVKYNKTNISDIQAVHWQAHNVPDRCWLFPREDKVKPVETVFFDTDEVYFDGTEIEGDDTWAIFTFYMLENCQRASKPANSYYDREKRKKEDSGESGYVWDGEESEFEDRYVDNHYWLYAPDHATYVDFDLVLTLTPAGISSATGSDVNNALTTDAIYNVHLGDFTSSDPESPKHNYDDYNTLRNHAYTYNITVNNSRSIYVEVVNDREEQAGQEGSLLLTSDEIVNADAHYEYHSLTFKYGGQKIARGGLSWYVKTPFTPGGQPDYRDGRFYADGLDYKWVKYAVNTLEGGHYSSRRRQYPGEALYDPHWLPDPDAPDSGLALNPDTGNYDQLLDINQLILLLYDQSEKRYDNVSGNLFRTEGTGDAAADYLRITAFIDEFYYDCNPITGEVDPDLWRKFVNAKPREMHILSDAHLSRDKQSDVIKSSHSIVQASIQSIYNEYAPGLRTIWGTEHRDEIKEKLLLRDPAAGGWTLWPDGGNDVESEGKRIASNGEVGRRNGRLNTAYSWGMYDSKTTGGNPIETLEWDEFLDFEVDNNTPELKDGYQGMIYSCLIRNRDNNGNGLVERDEVRWYLAAADQLLGLFVGNEALSLSARLYQMAPGEWRAHIISSTGGAYRVLWAEEGAAFGAYDRDKQAGGVEHTWASYTKAAHGQSVRCVRNVGTYDDEGVVKDVTHAPYSFVVDEYYTRTEEGTGDNTVYTFDFSRLNNKSIREYSMGELPYHDQMSMNNRLYAKMQTQKKADRVLISPSVKHKDVNPNVAAGGNNPYCPPGYRFPNMSEALMMWVSDMGGFYGDGSLPTRTYYDKGYYGAFKSDFEPWSVEGEKIGWLISGDGSIHAVNDVDITRSRCVRDYNMTGIIEGELLLEDTALCPEDYSDLLFNFSSRASALSYATLKVCFYNHEGNYREIDIPIENPHGVQYRQTHRINIPSLAELGLEESDLPRSVTIQAELRNVDGQRITVERAASIEGPIGVTLDFPLEFDAGKGVPALTTLKVNGHGNSYTGLTLYWKKDGGSWNARSLFSGSDTETIHDRTFLGDIDPTGFKPSADLPSSLETDTQTKGSDTQELEIYTNTPGPVYSFYAKAVDADGKEYVTPVRSVQLLRFDYTPNPDENGDGWATTDREGINKGWYNSISRLSLAAGDYIETLMDLTPCSFLDKGTDNEDLGLDNIFAFGNTTIKWAGHPIQFYYPSDGASAKLLIHPLNPASLGQSLSSSKYTLPDKTLSLRFDKKGVCMNGQYLDDNNIKITHDALKTSENFLVGSREGIHQSRAVYKFVRVVRQGDASWMNTGFGPGPIEGGDL